MLSRLAQGLQLLLDAPEGVIDDDQRRQARLLSFLLLVFTPIGSGIILHRWFEYRNELTLLIGGVLMLGFVVIFFISRTRYFQIGGVVLVLMVTGAVIYSIMLNLDSRVPLTYIVFSSLVAVMILQARAAIMISIINIVVAYIFTFHTTFLTSIEPGEDFTFMVIMTIVVWIITLLRRYDLIEITVKNQEMLALKENQMVMELESKKTLLLKHFIQDVSHDLKTPISVIKTSTYILQKQSSSEQHKRLSLIDEQTEYLNRIIEDLLSMSRLDEVTSLEKFPVDINAMLVDVSKQLNVNLLAKEQSLEVDYSENLKPILGDEAELRRCFVNLIQNANAYTPEGGTIRIKTSLDGSFIRVNIEDTGIGISKEELPFIFDRFYRVDKARTWNHYGGSGLGLAIVKRVIELHHGEINVVSTLGNGTCFCVRLPSLSHVSLHKRSPSLLSNS